MAAMLTREGIAEMLNLSVGKVDLMRRNDPDFPNPIRFGRALRWPREAVEQYIATKQQDEGPSRSGRGMSAASLYGGAA